ncbi:MAG: plastocyanin/azurin family copper-binding protein [Patescibacteria group bacterium]|jgi:plastocyanin
MKTVWLIPGFAVLLLGAGCALSKSQTNQVPSETTPIAEKKMDAPVSGVRAPDPGSRESEEASSEPSSPHIVTVDGGEFFFDPSSITAKTGETLMINFGTVTGHHIFTIDELNIAQAMTPGGSVTFTVPSTPGRYTYYCSVGPHRTLGMTGTLIVE